jgi:hypothetical protein
MKNLKLTIFSACLLLSGCFMVSPVPLSPVEYSYYDNDLVDTWIMTHNKRAITLIEAHDSNRLRISFPDIPDIDKQSIQYLAHISTIDAKTYVNAKQTGHGLYEIFMIERPCPDLILLYVPDPGMVEKDIKSGKVKGNIVLDFGKMRIIKESWEGLIHYIKSKKGKLFVPFRYMARKAKADNLSNECKAAIKPLPVDRGKMPGF